MKWISTILVIIFVAIPVFCAWRGYKNGLIRGLIGIVAIILAFAAANIVATTYSGEFTGMIDPFVGGIVDRAISTTEDVDENGVISPDEMSDIYGVTYNSLRSLGVSDSAATKIADAVNEQLGLSDGRLEERVTDYLCEKLAFILVFAVVFILIAIICAAIGNIINLAFSLPGLEVLNRTAGAVFGLFKGILILLFIACLFRYLGLILPENVLEKTVLLEWLIESNKLADIIGV